ncbi:hypothetical protein F4782DRAFT_168352 [Xylaria castorea]|nr:hypothetical protein F4782DRAFT_168352 [Xylaria castorea]
MHLCCATVVFMMCHYCYQLAAHTQHQPIVGYRHVLTPHPAYSHHCNIRVPVGYASFLGHRPVGLLSSLRLRDRTDEKGQKKNRGTL